MVWNGTLKRLGHERVTNLENTYIGMMTRRLKFYSLSYQPLKRNVDLYTNISSNIIYQMITIRDLYKYNTKKYQIKIIKSIALEI